MGGKRRKAALLFPGFIYSRDFYRDELSKDGWVGQLHFWGVVGKQQKNNSNIYADDFIARCSCFRTWRELHVHSMCFPKRRVGGLPEGERLSSLNHYRKQKVSWLLFSHKNNSLYTLGIWAVPLNQTDNLGKLVCASKNIEIYYSLFYSY